MRPSESDLFTTLTHRMFMSDGKPHVPPPEFIHSEFIVKGGQQGTATTTDQNDSQHEADVTSCSLDNPRQVCCTESSSCLLGE